MRIAYILTSLGIGGADGDANLWLEPRRSIEPVWNAERKDALEARLCQLVCAGRLDVREAQRRLEAGDQNGKLVLEISDA